MPFLALFCFLLDYMIGLCSAIISCWASSIYCYSLLFESSECVTPQMSRHFLLWPHTSFSLLLLEFWFWRFTFDIEELYRLINDFCFQKCNYCCALMLHRNTSVFLSLLYSRHNILSCTCYSRRFLHDMSFSFACISHYYPHFSPWLARPYSSHSRYYTHFYYSLAFIPLK